MSELILQPVPRVFWLGLEVRIVPRGWQMKIADVKIQVIKRDIPVPEGIGLRHEGMSFMESLAEVPVVRILTDEGIEGNAFSSYAMSGMAMGQFL